MVEATISPKKKAQTRIGKWWSRYSNPFAREKILIAIPVSTLKRKLPLTASQNSDSFP
jgi:hypothetical protein